MSQDINQTYQPSITHPDQTLELYNLWQFGDWTRLAQIETQNASEEHIALKASAQLQLGETQLAKNTLSGLPIPPSEQTARLLISGVFNTLGKARAILGDRQQAEAHFVYAIETGISTNITTHAIQARKNEQLAQLNKFTRWVNIDSLDQQGHTKKLFIDCGGHDGCSIIKFKLYNPTYDIITFEGNPELWPYYENLPAHLIKKLVSDHNGEVEFIIDPVDADGSSIIKEKNIDFYKKVKNEDCPIIVTPCQDLSEFIAQQAENYQEIILKLDVEGAEYAILNKMLQDGTVKHVKKLYAEFHWNKINLPKEEHDALIEQLQPFFDIEGWDAAEFQVHTKNVNNQKIRKQILNTIC